MSAHLANLDRGPVGAGGGALVHPDEGLLVLAARPTLLQPGVRALVHLLQLAPRQRLHHRRAVRVAQHVVGRAAAVTTNIFCRVSRKYS